MTRKSSLSSLVIIAAAMFLFPTSSSFAGRTPQAPHKKETRKSKSKSKNRTPYNNMLRCDLTKKIRILAAEKGKRQNDFLEEALKDFLNKRNVSADDIVDHGSEPRSMHNTTLDRGLTKGLRIRSAELEKPQNALFETSIIDLLKKYKVSPYDEQ